MFSFSRWRQLRAARKVFNKAKRDRKDWVQHAAMVLSLQRIVEQRSEVQALYITHQKRGEMNKAQYYKGKLDQIEEILDHGRSSDSRA